MWTELFVTEPPVGHHRPPDNLSLSDAAVRDLCLYGDRVFQLRSILPTTACSM